MSEKKIAYTMQEKNKTGVLNWKNKTERIKV